MRKTVANARGKLERSEKYWIECLPIVRLTKEEKKSAVSYHFTNDGIHRLTS